MVGEGNWDCGVEVEGILDKAGAAGEVGALGYDD